MPLYEYRCEACTKEFTLLQSMSVAAGKTVCPSCGESRTRRLFSAFATKGPEGGGTPGPAAGGCAPGGCGCH